MSDLLSTFTVVDFPKFVEPIKAFRMKFYSDFHSVFLRNKSSVKEERKLLTKRNILAVFKLNLKLNL